jgi:hypothetical protein
MTTREKVRKARRLAKHLRTATVPYPTLAWPVPRIVQRNEPEWIKAAEMIERLCDIIGKQRRKIRRIEAAHVKSGHE